MDILPTAAQETPDLHFQDAYLLFKFLWHQDPMIYFKSAEPSLDCDVAQTVADSVVELTMEMSMWLCLYSSV